MLSEEFVEEGVVIAGIAGDAGNLITAAQAQHWDVGVVATPQSLGFIDIQGRAWH